MSNILEMDRAQNCIEEIKFSGGEIVELVDYQSQNLHKKLANILRLMVTQTVSELKDTLQVPMIDQNPPDMANSVAVPTSSEKPEDPVATPPGTAARKGQSVTTSLAVGHFSVSFEFPEYITANNIDMDRVASSHQKFLLCPDEGNMKRTLQYSFRERLENWNIECRKRPSGRCDVFYRYPKKSRRMFRSIVEVINFLLYEIYPDSFGKENKGTLADNQDSHMAIEGSREKRKRKSTSEGGRRTKHRKMAEKNGGLGEKNGIEMQAAEEQNNIAEVIDISKDRITGFHEEEEEKSLPEHEEETCTFSELLDISEDWTAYEAMLDDYFD